MKLRAIRIRGFRLNFFDGSFAGFVARGLLGIGHWCRKGELDAEARKVVGKDLNEVQFGWPDFGIET